MKILFLTVGRFGCIEDPGIYTDLLRNFRDHGHEVYIVAAREKKTGLETELMDDHGAKVLHVKIGNITKCSSIEKGISTLLIANFYQKALKKYFGDIAFDLILYSTPPVTLSGVVEYVKKRTGARTYLLLKDIFPQNAVDMGMFSKNGLIYRYFRHKETKLYALSDTIGCMSQANCDFTLKHHPEISPERVEVCPNSIMPVDRRMSEEQKNECRRKYQLPVGKKIFVYGGNLGTPQDVPFVIRCLQACAGFQDAYFVLAGSGTKRHLLEEYVANEKPTHVKLFGLMPKEEYDEMIGCCDVGLIFLDHRFTIPNFPSRLLSYMQAGLPVLACTDSNTDVGRLAVHNGFGWWCESCNPGDFSALISSICRENIQEMGHQGFHYLLEHYTVEKAREIITNACDRKGTV